MHAFVHGAARMNEALLCKTLGAVEARVSRSMHELTSYREQDYALHCGSSCISLLAT